MKTAITIHGIRTRGKWQKDFVPLLQDAGFRNEVLDFGFFSTLKFLWPKCRQRKIDWLRDEYTRIVGNGPPPSIIAHSFGTYLVASALERYPEIAFDRIIFCGSIVQVHFDWDAVSTRFDAVLNDCGKKDFWSWVSPFVVKDAGPSGVDGFSKLAAGKVQNRQHQGFRHSDYFYRLNYEKQWIPFLKGEELEELQSGDRPPANWKFRITSLVTVIVPIIILYFVIGFVLCKDWPWDPEPGPLVEPQISQEHLPHREEVFSDPEFPGDDVRLTLVNQTGRNIVILMFACEFAFREENNASPGWYQAYIAEGQKKYVENFPATHGWHLFFAKGKCDPEPVRIKAFNLFGGEYPYLYFTSGEDSGYNATMRFGREGDE